MFIRNIHLCFFLLWDLAQSLRFINWMNPTLLPSLSFDLRNIHKATNCDRSKSHTVQRTWIQHRMDKGVHHRLGDHDRHALDVCPRICLETSNKSHKETQCTRCWTKYVVSTSTPYYFPSFFIAMFRESNGLMIDIELASASSYKSSWAAIEEMRQYQQESYTLSLSRAARWQVVDLSFTRRIGGQWMSRKVMSRAFSNRMLVFMNSFSVSQRPEIWWHELVV